MDEPSQRVDWRRVVLYAVVMAIGVVLVWKASERSMEERLSRARQDSVGPAHAVTDISEFWVRRRFFHHRDLMKDLSDSGQGDVLVEWCGQPRYFEGGAPFDIVRLTFTDAWMEDAFTVELRAIGRGANATWHRIEESPRNDASRTSQDYWRLGPALRRHVEADDWQAVLGAIRAPAYLGMANEDPRGTDCDTVVVESCIDGRYHYVGRSCPSDRKDREFLDAARTIQSASGRVHAITEYTSLEIETEDGE